MKLLAIFLLFIFTIPALASENGPTWKYIEFGYVEADVDGVEIDLDGFTAEFATLLTNDVFLIGSYDALSEDLFGVDIELDKLEFGVGYRIGLTDNSDFAAAASFVDAEVCGSADGFGSECIDDTGYGIKLSYRNMLTEQFEFFISFDYLDVFDDSETATGAGIAYNFTDTFAVKLAFESADDVDQIGISARFEF